MTFPPSVSETSLEELLASAPFRLPPRALSPLREAPSCLSTCLTGIVRVNSAQGLQTSVGSVDAHTPIPPGNIKIERDTPCTEYPPDMSFFADSEDVPTSCLFFTSEDYQKYSAVTSPGTGTKRSRSNWTGSSSNVEEVVQANRIATQPASNTLGSGVLKGERSEESTLPSTPPSHPPSHVGVTVATQLSSQSASQATSQYSNEADGTLDSLQDATEVHAAMEDLQQAAKAYAQIAQDGAGAQDPSSQGSNWSAKAGGARSLGLSQLGKQARVIAQSATPQWSRLRAEEHAYYLEACNPCATNSDKQEHDAEHLAKLTAIVKAEQEQYVLQQQSIVKSDAHRYHYCHADVAAQVDALMAKRRDRVRRAPRLWHRYRSLSLEKLWKVPGEVHMQPLRRIERYGVCPEFISPAPNVHLNRRTCYLAGGQDAGALRLRIVGGDARTAPSATSDSSPFIGPSPRPAPTMEHEDPLSRVRADNNRAPVYGRRLGGPGGRKHGAGDDCAKNRPDRPCVSEDCEARRLAGVEGAQVVLSSSSLSMLIATLPPTYGEGWELPVRVEPWPLESKREGTVVYVDKPLVKRRMTLREKNTIFYKHALQHAGTHFGRGNVLNLGTQLVLARTAVGVYTPAAITQPAERPQEVHDQPAASSLSESDPSDDEMCIDEGNNALPQGTGTDPNSAVKLAPEEGGGPCLNGEGSNKADRQAEVAIEGSRRSWDECQTPRADNEVRGGNLTYVLWRLGELKLLLRCEYRAHIRDTTSRSGYKFTVSRAKMEYRPHEGWEGITAEETARWWAASLLRPEALVVIGRIAPTTSTLLRLSHRSTAQLEQHADFNSARASNALLLILQHLKLLPPGNYLLVHPPMSPHVICYRECADRAIGSQNPSAEETYPELPCEKGVCAGVDCPSKQCPLDWRQPPCESCAGTPFDLHKAHSHSGQSDKDTLPTVSWWKPADPSVPQIPNTFPINPCRAARNKKGKRKKNMTKQNSTKNHDTTTGKVLDGAPTSLDAPTGNAKPSYRPRFPDLKYCFGFAEQGVCRSQDKCPFPHWTYEHVQRMAKELKIKPKLHKKSKGICKMFARTGRCNAGFECSYAHTPGAAVYRKRSSELNSIKVKGSPLLPREEYSELLTRHMLMRQNEKAR